MIVINNNKSGFTSIQFISILALLIALIGFAIALTNPLGYLQKNSDAKRKADLKNLAKVLENYYHDRGRYPSSLNYQMVDFKTNTPINWGDAWIPYMQSLPKDPSSSRRYVYVATNNNQSYYLYASFEATDDPDRCYSGGPGICESLRAQGISENVCGGRCNYGLSSPNTAP